MCRLFYYARVVPDKTPAQIKPSQSVWGVGYKLNSQGAC